MLIGLSGKQRSGKDTFADFLVELYGFKKVSFANPIKELAVNYFGLNPVEVYETKPEKVRIILQDIGKIGRKVDDLFWVKKTLDKFDNFDDIDVVVSDVRFINEAEYIKSKGGIIVRIESSRDIRASRGLLTGENDISEIELDNYDFDYVINNEGTIEEFYDAITQLMNILLHRWTQMMVKQ